MQALVPHHVVYDFDGKATVQEVARSLIAQEKLLREAINVLQACFEGLEIQDVSISVSSVTQESPLSTLMTGIVIGAYSAEIGQDMPDILDTLFGYNVNDSYDSLVSVVVLLIAIYGIDWLIKRMFPDKEKDAIDRERDRLLLEAANRASVTQDQMEEAVENALLKRQRSVSKAAMDFLQPAQRHKARQIQTDGALISEDAIKAIPTDIDIADYEPPTDNESFTDVLIQFRAHDLDQNKRWAATIEDVSKDRKPMHLAPDIQPNQLFNKTTIRGDVLVTSVRDPDGEYVPSLYILEKIYDDDA